MELTDRMRAVISSVAALLIVAMLGWNIAQQRELSVLRDDMRGLEGRLVENRKDSVAGLVSGITAIASAPTPPAKVRPAHAKAKAKAREGEPRARANGAPGSKAKARKATARAGSPGRAKADPASPALP